MKKIPKVQAVRPYGALFVLQLQLRMDSSVPLLTRSSDYFEWKVKMFVFMNRQDLYWVSDGFSRECFESDNEWINSCDVAFGIMKLDLSPSFHYLSRSIKDPKEL